jgi:eukaryotic-like serine/threonine-protein kinase
MKKTTIIILVIGLVLIGVVTYFLTQRESVTLNQGPDSIQEENQQNQVPKDEGKTVIGTSVQKNDLTAYHYGTGNTELLFVGGIHGGYEWNTSLLAYELMDYLEANPNVIPQNIKVTVIPVLNPDGLNKVVGTTGRFSPEAVSSSNDIVVSGRFNSNGVDLNRNFDCDWQTKGVWQDKTVSGGNAVFSEPESQAVKSYIEAKNPKVVVVFYSAAGGVFASNCHNGILSETRAIMNVYANASGYKAYDSFDFYETTGDMVNWLAKNNIPAISVLLSTHESIEWTKNQAGIEAIIKHYAN